MKTLFLETRGCDFFKNDLSVKNSDVGNYRLDTLDYDVLGYDGNRYFIEFRHGTKYSFRDRNYKTGKKIKPKTEIKTDNALFVSLCYKNESGTWGNWRLENTVFHCDFPYTLSGILAAVNMIAKEKYDAIEIIDSLPF